MWLVAAGLVAGSSAALLLPQVAPLAVLALVSVISVAACFCKPLRCLAAIGLGLVSCSLHLAARLEDRLARELEGQAITLRGTVRSVPQGTLELLKFRFAPARAVDGQPKLPALIELSWYDAPARIEAAEELELTVKLRRPRGFANPGGQDNEARMLREGLGASGYVRSGRRLGRPADAVWRQPVLVARAAIAGIIRETLAERPSSGIVAGLAVGLQDAVSREQWLVLSRSGTSHLMAISGLHIAMVAACAAWLGAFVQRIRQRWFSATRAQRDAAVMCGLGAGFAYSLLAGWSVPTQRTMVMIAGGALALILRRRLGVLDGIGLCAAAVVLIDPLAPLAPGFWLSFGAVAAILFGATGHLSRQGLLRGYLHVQLIVTIGLVPVLAGSFGSISLVSALVNLYAIPLYTLVVVPAVLVSCAVAMAWAPAGAMLLDWTGRLIEWTWPLLEVPAGWTLATWPIAGLHPIAWCALVLGTLAALAPLPAQGRAAGVVMAVAACLWRPAPIHAGAARVTVLDVGQGLGAVVETRNHTLVFDVGPSFRTGTDTGQLVLAPYLRHRALRRIDMLVVSHDDDDHKGGAGSLLALVPTAQLVTGPSLERADFAWRGRSRATCRRGGRWRWDDVEFEWLHPGSGSYERDNDSSCVLLVTAGEHRVLLTGDVEAIAEAEMLALGLIAPVSIVVAPHHGSRTSSTQGFVDASRPHWVVYAVGHRNRWNFPASRVVERWEATGSRAVQTSSSGAIVFDLSPGLPLPPPAAWRLQKRRLWRDP